MKRSTLPPVLVALVPLATAHSTAGTPGIELHHLSTWGWAGIALLFAALLYIVYVQTHDLPWNPAAW